MNAAEQFHVGIVVDDFETTLGALSELFGYEWCDEIGGQTTVTLPGGDAVLDLRFAYSMTLPRLEIIRSLPGTLWEPAAGSGIHHLGYWSDDVRGDSDQLVRRGWEAEAIGRRPNGEPYWAYHRNTSGPRIELVSRALQPVLGRYWATGKAPS